MLTLDVGSGNLPDHVARGNVCIDIIKRPCHRPPMFVCADANHLPFREEAFDRVMFFHVMEHVANPTACLKEIQRVLKPHGEVRVSVPNIYHYRNLFKIIRGKYPHDDTPDHIAAWTPWELQNLLRIAGFCEVLISFYCFGHSHRRRLDALAMRLLVRTIGMLHLFASAKKVVYVKC